MKGTATTPVQRKPVLNRVGENLYRHGTSEIYYAIFKTRGKQIRRSLKTTDRDIARRRCDEMRGQVGRLATEDGRRLPFAEYDDKGVLIGGLAQRWIEVAGAAIEPSTRDRYLENIDTLSHFFGRLSARAINLKHLEAWNRGRTDCAASSFNKEFEVLRRILDYGVKTGALLENRVRASDIKRRKGHKKPIEIPSREEFSQVIATMRANGAHASADLWEILGYSGCRLSEVVGNQQYKKEPLRWRDIRWDIKKFVVTKSKNHEPRIVPLFPALERFLRGLQAQLPHPPKPDDRIITIRSARTAVETACRQLDLTKYGHHTCRHFFCSNALEIPGNTFKVVAAWLGHRDGGVLVARTYGHLRDKFSEEMAGQMTWSAATEEDSVGPDVNGDPENVIPFQLADDGDRQRLCSTLPDGDPAAPSTDRRSGPPE